jgi:toxin FitB
VFLLDTNVISELRKPRPHGGVLAWIARVPENQLFLSAVTLGELQAGVELTREQDPQKAREIEAWIEVLAACWNLLSVDAQTFRIWARLTHRSSSDLFEDALIAATAKVHGLTVATRNVRDFRSFGVPLVDPFGFRS